MSANTPSQHTPSRSRRLVPWLALGLVPVVLGSSAVAAQSHKSVDLEVDGEAQTVSTFAGSVGGLLEDEGIDIGKHDVVAPGADTPLTEGADIVVRTARQVTVVINGEQRRVWTTAPSAGEVVAGLFEAGRNVSIAASRSLDGGREVLDLPLVIDGEVVVVADGDSVRVQLEGEAYVADALRAADVEAGPDDRVEVGTAEDGTVQVTVSRVAKGERTDTISIDFDSVERPDDSLYEGQTRVVQEGAEGERTFAYDVVTVDGDEVWSQLSGTTVTTKPTDRIVAVGTAERPSAPSEPARTTAPSAGSGSAGSDASSSSAGSSQSSAGSSQSSAGSSSGSAGSSSGSSSAGSAGSSSGSSSADSAGSAAPSGGVWARLAQCESGGDPTIVSGNGLYYGLYQFSVGTWQSVGGSGLPSQASPAEQTKRAQMLQARSGWGQWPHCSSVLGLR